MLAQLGTVVLAVDLDPQANLTSYFFDEEELQELWDSSAATTVFGSLGPMISGLGDVERPKTVEIAERLHVLPGHLALAGFEDRLSRVWPDALLGKDQSALRVTTAFHRIIQMAASDVSAEVVLIDIGPNLGAINRATLITADWILTPLAADLFSLQGLRNLGPTLEGWHEEWQMALARKRADVPTPDAEMAWLGYVLLQHSVRLDRPVKAFQRWSARIPGEYHHHVVGDSFAGTDPEADPYCLASLRNYRSLVPLAQDARKPMFDLKAADGALGSTARFVEVCRQEFEALALRVLAAVGL